MKISKLLLCLMFLPACAHAQEYKPFFTGYTLDSYSRVQDFCESEHSSPLFRYSRKEYRHLVDSCWFDVFAWELSQKHFEKISDEQMLPVSCVTTQIDWYGDLCAESSVGYEDMKGSEAYYYGVRCAVEAALMCGGYESMGEEYE